MFFNGAHVSLILSVFFEMKICHLFSLKNSLKSKLNFVFDCVAFDEESINFLSKKKLIKKALKVASDGKERYKETWKNLSVSKLIKLSEISDFDELDMTVY